MSDKQIIIKRIRDCDNCKFRPETSKVCEIYDNCYLVSEHIVNLREQLRTKEQECEELNKTITNLENIRDEFSTKLDQLKAEVKSKTEYIQEQRDIINQYSKEIEMYKKCQGKRASKREEELKAENEKMSKGYSKLTEIVSPYMDDFTGYNEELGGFDLILCVKELLEQLDQLKETNEDLLSIQYKLADNNKQLRQTLEEIKVFVMQAKHDYNLPKCLFDTILQKISEVENEHNG